MIQDNGILAQGSGTVVPEGFSEDWSLIELDTEGKPYKYYNLDGTPDEARIQLEEQREQLIVNNTSARAYLNETDWYIARYTETGKEIPPVITEARTNARESISVSDPK